MAEKKRSKKKIAGLTAFLPLVFSHGVKAAEMKKAESVYGPPPDISDSARTPLFELVLRVAAILLIPAVFIVGAILFYKKSVMEKKRKIWIITAAAVVVALILVLLLVLL